MRTLKLLRSLAAAAGVVLGTVAVLPPASAQQPATIMVPYPAGGLSDVIARMVEKPFSKAIGKTVIVDNVGSAGDGVAGSGKR